MAQPSQYLKVDRFFKKDHPKRNLSLKFLYFKSIFALVLGVALGYFKVTGAIGFMVFLPVQYLLIHVYCSHFNVPDYLLDKTGMFTEQILPSFGLFLVVWTVTYTLFY